MAQESERKDDTTKESSNDTQNLPPAKSPETGTEGFASASDDAVVEESHREIGGLRWAMVVAAILSSTFLYALDNTIVANIRPSIVVSLGQINKLPWVSVAYAVGEVGSNPFWYDNLATEHRITVSDRH